MHSRATGNRATHTSTQPTYFYLVRCFAFALTRGFLDGDPLFMRLAADIIGTPPPSKKPSLRKASLALGQCSSARFA